MRSRYRAVKRMSDIAISCAVLAVGALPGVALAVAVAIDTRGFPIYAQERCGYRGRFPLLKYRTMVRDSDDVEKYLDEDQLAQWRRERKVDDDGRVTALGRVLRATSIDELPQFANVLVGQMSVVGPRPVTRDELLEHLTEDERRLYLSVPGGITGAWQVGPRNRATWRSGERLAIELDYVAHASLALDASIMLRTLGAMFVHRSGR